MVRSIFPLLLIHEVFGVMKPEMEIGIFVSGNTITAEEVQPFAPVTVTMYVLPGILFKSCVVFPFDQRKVKGGSPIFTRSSIEPLLSPHVAGEMID